MKIIKKNFYKLVLSIYVFFVPLFMLYAQKDGVGQNPSGSLIKNPINVDSIPGLIQKILEGLITIGLPVVALAIVYCGFLFVFARGNPDKLKEAKSALFYTIIGAAVLLGAWAIAKMIQTTVLAL